MSGTTQFAPNPDVNATTDGNGGLARIFDNIQIRAPGVAFAVVRAAIFDAAEEFCSRSCVWRQTICWHMPVGSNAVELNTVPSAIVAYVLRVEGMLAYRIRPPSALLDPTCSTDTDRKGCALVVLKPQTLDGVLPGLLINHWGHALRDGALAQIHAQMGKPYSDPKLAMVHQARFRSAIWLAKETVRTVGDLAKPGFAYFANGAQRGMSQLKSMQGASDPCCCDEPLFVVPATPAADTRGYFFDGGTSWTTQFPPAITTDGGTTL